METADNILCLKKEQSVLTGFYEELAALLQDSDAMKEKEQLKAALKSMSSTTTCLILGEQGVGKTELLKYLFQDIFDVSDNMTANICEYRYGAEDARLPAVEGFEKRFIASENLMGLSVIDTKGINTMNENEIKKISELLERCSAVLVAFSSQNVNSLKVWDAIERCPEKKMLFLVTKCDLSTEQELEKNIARLKCYMKDSRITAPLFPVSIPENGTAAGTTKLETVRLYLRDNVIGKNPILQKQRENVNQLEKLLVQFQGALQQRKKQYASDQKILCRISASLDNYVANQQEIIAALNRRLVQEINEDIDRYQAEIISKMDPLRIKERFSCKEDFESYLNLVNDNYKSMMNESINRKTIETMKGCLHDLEIIFKEAVGYFNQRENILALNDRFYGSMSKSRREIVANTKETVMLSGEFYKTLSEASEELFLKIWSEREKYDNAIKTRRTLSMAGGGGAAGGIAGLLLSSLGSAGATTAAGTAAAGTTAAASTAAAAGTTAAGAAAAGFSTFLITAAVVVVAAIVGAVVINQIAKTIFDPKMAGRMEEACKKSIEDFKMEVSKTKLAMTEQITGQVRELFEKELNAVDGYFTEFRISVNVDGEKIPQLEERLEKVTQMIEVIHNLETQEAHGNEC